MTIIAAVAAGMLCELARRSIVGSRLERSLREARNAPNALAIRRER